MLGVDTFEKALEQKRLVVFQRATQAVDELSARIGRSLERFLASVDALGDREREIIQLHRASLGRLADLQGESREERMEVVEGLETLVRRRLRD